MTQNFVQRALKAHEQTQQAGIEEAAARESSTAARLAAARTRVSQRWSEHLSEQLAQVLGGNSRDPEFQNLAWRMTDPLQVRIENEQSIAIRPRVDLGTTFQGVPIRTSRPSAGPDDSDFYERAFSVANEKKHFNFYSLASFGAAIVSADLPTEVSSLVATRDQTMSAPRGPALSSPMFLS